MFKEVKSIKFFSHQLGGNYGGYVEMWGFESLADLEKWVNKYRKDKDYTTFHPEFIALIVPGTYSINIWTPVAELQ